jgi:SAM-dependent methyltransferase
VARVLRRSRDVGDDRWGPPPYPPSPADPRDPAYAPLHRRFVTDALGSAALLHRLGSEGDGTLPGGYGLGLDERVVEWPWLLSRVRARGGPVLDAGSTLNHAHVLDAFLPAAAPLHVVTLHPEAEAHTERGISYIYADLRDLPLRDSRFATVICASTLEHVGMDNARYGAEGGGAVDPRFEAGRALDEIRRVLAPGGAVLITVPFGRREDHGWFRQYDNDDLAEMVERSRLEHVESKVYAYSSDGWRLSAPEAAAGLAYHDVHATGAPAPDGAAAARAVACVELRRA